MRDKSFQQMVTEFHKLFNHPIGQSPQFLSDKLFNRRIDWMREEINELEDAVDIESQLDALGDLLYFAIGFFVEMGVDAQRIFELIHEANMAKAKGGIRHLSNGKIIKPDNWKPPEIRILDYVKSMQNEARLQDQLDEVIKQRDNDEG